MAQLNPTKKFNELCLTERALILSGFGIYLDSIESFDHWIHLYSLNHNFVEVSYNIADRQIDDIKMITYAEIDKYLTRIVFTHG